MSLPVKSGDAAASKYKDNAGRAGDAYKSGAVAAASTWAANTQAAAGNFKQAIQASGIDQRFSKGVAKAGAGKFAEKVTAVGGDRYAPGVAAGAADYRSGVDPYLQTMSGLTLAPRKPRGDPSNLKRVEQITSANHMKRLALLGSSAA
jgi:hypothetical protein